jgi:beta-catenin-like protein 1
LLGWSAKALAFVIMNGIEGSNGTSRDNPDAASRAFHPAATFQGSKPGYVFRAGHQGTGYYLDDILQINATNSHDEIAEPNSTILTAVRQTPQELLEEAEAQAKASSGMVITLDAAGVTKGANSLAKAYSRNQLQRSRFHAKPEKYMNSEVDLYEALSALQGLAANPSLYDHLTIDIGDDDQSAAHVMIQCMAHENLDVVTAALETWNELIDVNIISLEKNEGKGQQHMSARHWIPSLGVYFLDHQGLELLSASLSRLEFQDLEGISGVGGEASSFDSDMYKRGLEGILSLLDTLLDLDMSGALRQATSDLKQQSVSYKSVVSRIWSSSPTLLTCLLERVGGQSRNRDSLTVDMEDLTHNAAEILATVLQSEDFVIHCESHLMKMPVLAPITDEGASSKPRPAKKSKSDETSNVVDGVEMLLQAVAPYRLRDPATASECEYCENCLNALAASLMRGGSAIVSHFIELEGLELMLRLISGKFHVGNGALKVLNYCLSGTTASSGQKHEESVYEQACAQLVDAGGLKVIFPIMMGKGAAVPVSARCTDAGQGIKGISSSRKSKRIIKAKKEWLRQVEYHAMFILYALTRYLKDASFFDAKKRCLAKFVEGDCVRQKSCPLLICVQHEELMIFFLPLSTDVCFFLAQEKCDRITELFLQYDAKMRLAEAKFLQSSKAEAAEEDGGDLELATVDAKLKGGGDVCHRIGAIIAFVCTESKRCHNHILNQLQMNSSGISGK